MNPDPSRGMFSSIQIGLAAAQGDPSSCFPGDMPFVRPATVAARALRSEQALAAIVSPRFQDGTAIQSRFLNT